MLASSPEAIQCSLDLTRANQTISANENEIHFFRSKVRTFLSQVPEYLAFPSCSRGRIAKNCWSESMPKIAIGVQAIHASCQTVTQVADRSTIANLGPTSDR